MSCLIMKKRRSHCTESDVWSQPDICGILEKYSRCNKRENIGTLSRVGRECPIMNKCCSHRTESDVRGISEKYSSRNTIPIFIDNQCVLCLTFISIRIHSFSFFSPIMLFSIMIIYTHHSSLATSVLLTPVLEP